MKRFNIFTAILMICFTAVTTSGQNKVSSELFETFGANFSEDEEITKNYKIYHNLQLKDTLTTQLVGNINEVCQAMGCWMKVNLANNDEVFVKFKDYGFFVPKDASGRQVVMNGKAFIEELSVEDQRHYASDKGATEAEIFKITKPKKTLRFEADGVAIKK